MKRLSEFKYDQERNDYLDGDCGIGEDKCAVVMHILGYCGCGRPEDALVFIRDGLQLIDEKLDPTAERTWEELYQDWNRRLDKHFGSAGARYFFFYWADKEGLTEHGGSVPGWLSGSGRDLLEDLNEALSEKRGSVGGCGRMKISKDEQEVLSRWRAENTHKWEHEISQATIAGASGSMSQTAAADYRAQAREMRALLKSGADFEKHKHEFGYVRVGCILRPAVDAPSLSGVPMTKDEQEALAVIEYYLKALKLVERGLADRREQRWWDTYNAALQGYIVARTNVPEQVAQLTADRAHGPLLTTEKP